MSVYGTESWELDALEPKYISDLIRENVLLYRDDWLWQEAVILQEREREQIAGLIKGLKGE
jgi:hypothetical protein